MASSRLVEFALGGTDVVLLDCDMTWTVDAHGQLHGRLNDAPEDRCGYLAQLNWESRNE